MLNFTQNALNASKKSLVKPNIIFVIEGIPGSFSAGAVYEPIRIGDPGLLIGDDWNIGGQTLVSEEEVAPLISLAQGGSTTSKIQQQLAPDRSQVTSATSLVVSLLDSHENISRLISPGFTLQDILGAKVKVLIGFQETNYPDDYVTIFRGLIQGVGSKPGLINFTLSSTDFKAKATIFAERESFLFGGNSNSPAIPADDPAFFTRLGRTIFLTDDDPGDAPDPLQEPVQEVLQVISRKLDPWPVSVFGPDGNYDVVESGLYSLEFFCHIDDEFFRYFQFYGANAVYVLDLNLYLEYFLGGYNEINGVGVVSDIEYSEAAAGYPLGKMIHGVKDPLTGLYPSHDQGAKAKLVCRLNGHPLELALKMLLSGWGGPFVEDVEVTSFVEISPGNDIPNCIFFEGVDLEDEYGITPGDYLETSGASNGANNVSQKRISDIVKNELGSYIIVDGVSFVVELSSSAVISFRSQYDVWPAGYGMKLSPAEVDVREHQRLHQTFFAGSDYDISLIVEDEITDAKDFINKMLYLPINCFGIPRKGRASVGLTSPLNNFQQIILNADNVMNADSLSLERTITKNFFNKVRAFYNYDPNTGEFDSSHEKLGDTTERIPVGIKQNDVNMPGYTTDQILAVENLVTKILNQYQQGAEFLNGVKVLLKAGLTLEIGDSVLVDFKSLKMTDINTGNRSGFTRVMDVLNKTTDIRNGIVEVDLIANSISGTDQYGMIGPSSFIDSGASTTRLPLKHSFSTKDFELETSKWKEFVGVQVEIRNENRSFSHLRTIESIDIGTADEALVLSSALPGTPSEDYIVEMAPYPSTPDTTDEFAGTWPYARLSPALDIVGGVGEDTAQISPSDYTAFEAQLGHFVSGLGARVRIHNEDYSEDSGEVFVKKMLGTDSFLLDREVGFTIGATHKLEILTNSFSDLRSAYRWV